MESIKHIYTVGKGPSSSHTMGPSKASDYFIKKYPMGKKYEVTLYGSLAATGRGHLTDKTILEQFEGRDIEIIWKPETFLKNHPNGMKFFVELDNKSVEEYIYSIGGGALQFGDKEKSIDTIYRLNSMEEILKYCEAKGLTYWEYVKEEEGEEIFEYLCSIWLAMKESIKRGLEVDGVLPGGLGLPRKALLYKVRSNNAAPHFKNSGMLTSFALAVSEENASGGVVVTAPTCGACGVLPSVLYYLQTIIDVTDTQIIKALATAGLVGNIIKRNGSISGAEVGCQGEIGSACAMAAAAASQILGGSVRQIEYAAEMGLEHHLGLTCDPVGGLVQIPCIERNSFAAKRALSCADHALLSDGVHSVSFDSVVAVMTQTGHDLPSLYRETSEGGLAAFCKGPNPYACD